MSASEGNGNGKFGIMIKITLAVGSAIVYVFDDEIRETGDKLANYMSNNTFEIAKLRRSESVEEYYAIEREIINTNNIEHYEIDEGEKILATDTYKIKIRGQTCYVEKDTDNNTITLYRLKNTNSSSIYHWFYTWMNEWTRKEETLMVLIKKTKDKIYQPDKSYMVYTVNNKAQWDIPSISTPMSNIKLTISMAPILLNIKEARENNKRFGCMLVGQPGASKTTLYKKIASLYNMPVYSLSLRSEHMTDGSLLNLCNKLKPNSILVLEEFEKQWRAIKKDTKSMITAGGILSALDGSVTKDPHSLVVLTCNKWTDSLNDDFDNALIRPGRIDKKYYMEVEYN